MTNKQIRESGDKRPLKKIRVGRFQMSLWVSKRLLTSGSRDSTAYIEKEVDVERVCIQYSTKNRATGQWENQSIWCSADDVRILGEVLDRFIEQDMEEDEKSSSPFSGGQ